MVQAPTDPISVIGFVGQAPATIDVPVGVAHEIRAAVRALRPVECELVTVLEVCSRY